MNGEFKAKNCDEDKEPESAQAKINEPGRRRQGSKPDGRDSARSAGCLVTKRWTLKRWLLFAVLPTALYLAMGAFLIYSPDTRDLRPLGIGIGLFVPVGWLLGALSHRYRLPHRARKLFQERKHVAIELAWDNDAVTFTTANSHARTPWSDSLKWRDSPHVLLLSLSRCVYLTIPKRDYLETRYRWIGRIWLPVWFAFCFGSVAWMPKHWRPWSFYLSTAVWLLPFAARALIKCPRCGKRLGHDAQFQPGRGKGEPRKPLQFIWCPHCGLGLDEPITSP
jgi:hypothetical protein